MKKTNRATSREDNNPLENFLLALVSGVMGFFTGLLIWFFTPVAFGISAKAYLLLSVILALVFFVFGLINPFKAADSMGSGWDFLTVLKQQVFRWIKLIK